MNRKPVVLIVDDDKYVRETFGYGLQDLYSTFQASNAEEAFEFLARHRVNIILLDIKLPGMDGITALRKIKMRFPEAAVIMISAIKEADTVVQALKAGAYHYFTKDLDFSEITLNIDNALAMQDEVKEKIFYKSEVERNVEKEFIVGKSSKMKIVQEVIDKVANLDANVLIAGKSGTGKELVARLIHDRSERRDKPFVPINMAALPDNLVESILFGHEKGAFTGATSQQIGKFELADSGTLFLDEIGELKKDLQAKLLRAIQGGEVEMVGGKRTIKVNVRLVSATNADLQQKVGEGLFREDLYYRLNVIPITLPTLLERMEDIPELVDHFIKKYGEKFKKPVKNISKDALDVLSHHPWPGNIRELENLIARIVAMTESTTIFSPDIPIEYQLECLLQEKPEGEKTDLLARAVETFERNSIIHALRKHKLSRKDAAASLGVALSTFKFKMTKLKIKELLVKMGDELP